MIPQLGACNISDCWYSDIHIDDVSCCRKRWGYDITTRQMCCAPFNDSTGSGRHVKLARAYEIIRWMLRPPQPLQTSRCTYLPFLLTTNSFWYRCRTLPLIFSKLMLCQPDTDVRRHVACLLRLVSLCNLISNDSCVCWTYHTSCDRSSIECVAIRSFRFLSCYFPHSFMHWFLSCGGTMPCVCACDVLRCPGNWNAGCNCCAASAACC